MQHPSPSEARTEVPPTSPRHTRSGQTEDSIADTVSLWVGGDPDVEFTGVTHRDCEQRLNVLLQAREQLLDHRALLCERLRAMQSAGCQEAAAEAARQQLADTDPVLAEHEWQIEAARAGLASVERLQKQKDSTDERYIRDPHRIPSLDWTLQPYHLSHWPGLAKKVE